MTAGSPAILEKFHCDHTDRFRFLERLLMSDDDILVSRRRMVGGAGLGLAALAAVPASAQDMAATAAPKASGSPHVQVSSPAVSSPVASFAGTRRQNIPSEVLPMAENATIIIVATSIIFWRLGDEA